MMIENPDDEVLYGESPPAEEKGETPETIDEEEAESPSVLVPTSSLPQGYKEGDTCTFKIIAKHGDEAELELVNSSKKSTTEQSAEEEIDAMEKA